MVVLAASGGVLWWRWHQAGLRNSKEDKAAAAIRWGSLGTLGSGN